MTRLNGCQVIGAVEQGIEKPVILYAGEAIECVDPVFDQRSDGHFRNARSQMSDPYVRLVPAVSQDTLDGVGMRLVGYAAIIRHRQFSAKAFPDFLQDFRLHLGEDPGQGG